LVGLGHTHTPLLVDGSDRDSEILLGEDLPSDRYMFRNQNVLVNPGSVGQPRDEDPRASYALFRPEQEALEFHRVSYDIDVVQEKILQAGYSTYLANRLAEGH